MDNKKTTFLVISLFAIIFFSGFVSAFDLEKHLVQTEVDENYPCHIENEDVIVCPAIDNKQIDDWKTKIDNLKPEEKDKGKLTDIQKKQLLSSKQVPYEKNKFTKTIDVTKEYREKIDIYKLDGIIKIGFNSNTFEVSGTPLENFDVNTTSGMVKYRPLNMTWLNLTYSSPGQTAYKSVKFPDKFTMVGTNRSLSIWINPKSFTTDGAGYNFLTLSNDTTKGINIYINGSGAVRVLCSQIVNLAYSGVLLTVNNWHNIIAICNSTQGVSNIYIDGVDTTLEYNTPISPTWTTNIIGSASGNRVNLDFDELRYYNLSLDSNNITDIYNSGLSPNSSLYSDNLPYWFTFDENNGSITQSQKNKSFIGNLVGDSGNGNISWASDNINVTTLGYNVNISLTNLTSALVFWNNGSFYNSTLNNSVNGNYTFTFLNNNTLYVLENFKVNQSNPTLYSPLNISLSNTTTRHIASNLSGTINATIIVNNTNCGASLWRLRYTTHSGVTTTWLGASARSECVKLSTTGENLSIEPASGSNELNYDYDTTNPIITVVSPIDGNRYGTAESLNITFTATDNVAVDTQWYSLSWITGNTTYSSSTNISLSNLPQGTYTVRLYANDTSNNIATTTLTIYIFTGSSGLCNSVTANGFAGFFSNVPVILMIAGLGILIFIIFALVKVSQGEVDVSFIEDAFENFPAGVIMWTIALIAIIAFIFVTIFSSGILC